MGKLNLQSAKSSKFVIFERLEVFSSCKHQRTTIQLLRRFFFFWCLTGGIIRFTPYSLVLYPVVFNVYDKAE